MNANRRLTLGTLALGTAAAVTGTAKAAESRPRALVIHVSQNDADLMGQALNYASNVLKHFGDRSEPVQVEILANGQGLHMLREDTSPVKGKVLAFMARNPKVVISACQNTKTNMEAAEGKEIRLQQGVRMVPAGIVRLMEAQEAGWSYVRP